MFSAGCCWKERQRQRETIRGFQLHWWKGVNLNSGCGRLKKSSNLYYFFCEKFSSSYRTQSLSLYNSNFYIGHPSKEGIWWWAYNDFSLFLQGEDSNNITIAFFVLIKLTYRKKDIYDFLETGSPFLEDIPMASIKFICLDKWQQIDTLREENTSFQLACRFHIMHKKTHRINLEGL